MKKENIKYLIALLLLIGCYFIYEYYVGKTETKMALYKDGYVDDCYNIKKDAPKQINLTKYIDDNQLKKSDSVNNDDYLVSKCIIRENYVLENYLEVKNEVINHTKGQNDTAYQLSYQGLLKEIKSKKQKNDLDKQIIKSLEYYLNDKSAKQLIPVTNKKVQTNSSLVGPTQDDKSGKYKLVVDLDIIKNKKMKLKNDKLNYKSSEFILDGLSTRYIEVGE